MDIGLHLRRTAERVPDKEAILYDNKRYTYREFNEWANRFSHKLLFLGVKKGDKVALVMQNSDDFCVSYYACAKVGAVVVPVNFRLTKPEAAYILEHSDSVLVIADQEYEQMVRAIAEDNRNIRHVLVAGADTSPAAVQSYPAEEPGVNVSEWDDFELLYTSGTTGKPKGALFDHHRTAHVALSIALGMKMDEDDRLLHVAPLFHCAQLNLFLATGTFLGATHIIKRNFDPRDILETITKEKVTLFFGVPTMYNFMLQVYDPATHDLSSVTRCGYGAAPMASSLVTRSMEMFGTDRFYNLAGLTEGGPAGVALTPKHHQRKLGASGKAWPGTVARVVNSEGKDTAPGEVGEFILQAESVMKEYYKNPDATSETVRDGWLYTGDLAMVDGDGFVTLVDRKKDMIISGGENVYSIEVENVLYQHSKILEAAVIGAPDETWGELVAAVVVPKPGESVTLEEIQQFCRDRLAGYKIPRAIYVRDSLPRNASGKVLKFALRNEYRGA